MLPLSPYNVEPMYPEYFSHVITVLGEGGGRILVGKHIEIIGAFLS